MNNLFLRINESVGKPSRNTMENAGKQSQNTNTPTQALHVGNILAQ